MNGGDKRYDDAAAWLRRARTLYAEHDRLAGEPGGLAGDPPAQMQAGPLLKALRQQRINPVNVGRLKAGRSCTNRAVAAIKAAFVASVLPRRLTEPPLPVPLCSVRPAFPTSQSLTIKP